MVDVWVRQVGDAGVLEVWLEDCVLKQAKMSLAW